MRNARKRRLMGEINVVPYIDVMLVLLVIFMVTAPLLTQGIDVQLPQAAADPIVTPQNQEPLVLSIDADGDLYLNVGDDEDAPLAADRIVELASAVLRRNPKTPVLVKADQRVAYGAVVQAMVLLQQAGAANVGFLTDAPATPRRRG
ncbi:MAG: protein TolR [Gammaproteobacteria bacterium]|nr:protein TolR [Gammaproteobacteria bacterium]